MFKYKTEELSRRVVSSAFWAGARQTLPSLRKKQAYRRLFLCLTLCPWYEKDEHGDEIEGCYVLPAELVAACEGQHALKALRGGRYNAEAFLKEFERDVNVNLNLSDPSYAAGKARTASPVWPVGIEYLLDDEANRSNEDRHSNAVYFVTGDKYDKKRHRSGAKVLQNMTADEIKRELIKHNTPARDLLDYANSESATVFWNLVRDNMATAEVVAGNLKKVNKDGTINAKATQQLIRQTKIMLQNTYGQPMPTYRPGKTSPRIFATGQNMVNLPRAVRKALMIGCDDFDLSNAQYAIACKVLDLKKGQQFLKAGGTLWHALGPCVGFTPDEMDDKKNGKAQDAKGLLKEGVYGALFGMRETPLYSRLKNGTQWISGFDEDRARAVMAHELIEELIGARERELDDLINAGYGKTCFGLDIPVSNRDDAKSVLSAQMQSIELQLLLPVLKLLRNNQDVYLVAWQHDGLAVKYRREREREVFREQARKAVAFEAMIQGVLTSLKVEML